MKVINERKNLIDFILNFAHDEYSTKEDLFNHYNDFIYIPF